MKIHSQSYDREKKIVSFADKNRRNFPSFLASFHDGKNSPVERSSVGCGVRKMTTRVEKEKEKGEKGREEREEKEKKNRGRLGSGIRTTSVVFIDASRPPMFLEVAPLGVLVYLEPGPCPSFFLLLRGREAALGRRSIKAASFEGEKPWQKKGRGTRRATVLTALLMHSYPCFATTC